MEQRQNFDSVGVSLMLSWLLFPFHYQNFIAVYAGMCHIADIAQSPWIHSMPMLLLLIYVAYPVSSLLFLWTQNPTTHYFKCSTIMNTFPFIVMTPTLMTTLCFHADVTGVFWCSILIYVRKWMLKVLPRLPLLQRKWEAPCVCAYVLAFMQ